jgi:hypothetical protein
MPTSNQGDYWHSDALQRYREWQGGCYDPDDYEEEPEEQESSEDVERLAKGFAAVVMVGWLLYLLGAIGRAAMKGLLW